MPALVPPLFPLCPLNTALRQALKTALQKSQKSETRPSLPARPSGPAKASCPPAPERRSGADRASPSCTKKPPGQRLIVQFTPSPLPLDAPRAGRGKPLSTHRPAARRACGRIHPAAVSPHVFAAAPDHPRWGWPVQGQSVRGEDRAVGARRAVGAGRTGGSARLRREARKAGGQAPRRRRGG